MGVGQLMIVDLGFMKLPFEGNLSIAKLSFGILVGIVLNVIVFNLCTPKGPAALLSGQPFLDACSKPAIVTACWIIIYYNHVGCQVLALFCSETLFDMYKKDDMTEKFIPNAARFS